MGDGLLSIFPIDSADQAPAATRSALAAAMEAVDAVRGLTSDPSLMSEPPFEIVVAPRCRKGWELSRSRPLPRAPEAYRPRPAALTAHQIRCERRQPIVSTFCPAKFERKVATFDIALLAQALPECSHMPRSQFWSLASEKSDHRQRRLLRAGRKRPRRRAAEQS